MLTWGNAPELLAADLPQGKDRLTSLAAVLSAFVRKPVATVHGVPQPTFAPWALRCLARLADQLLTELVEPQQAVDVFGDCV